MAKRFLVAVDGSEESRRAARLAAEIAAKDHEKVILLHIVQDTEIPEDVRRYIQYEYSIDAPEAFYQEVMSEKILEQARREVLGKGVDSVELVVDQGDPAKRIIELSQENDIDTVFMGHCERGGVRGILHGSVSRKVSHHTDCTCVIVN
jgi:nucleotide-binding universal stress UspA family protein